MGRVGRSVSSSPPLREIRSATASAHQTANRLDAIANSEGTVEIQNYDPQVWSDEPINALIFTLVGAGLIVMLVILRALLTI